VQATKKITRAMELIAASRIVKAQARVHAAVPYADGITDVVRNLQAAGGGANNPMLSARENTQNVAIIVITADRGLAGGYNSSVLRAAEGEMKEHIALGRSVQLVAVGRKAEGYFRFRDMAVADSHAGFTDNPSYENARAVATWAINEFDAGNLDLVQLVYTRFISAGRQEVIVKPLLPLDADDEDFTPLETSEGPSADYEFEPSPDAILEDLLPRYAEARVYAALLNAAASEHAARQRAMKAATDNAEELINIYTRRMNRARQDSITTEIMEIVGGAEALSQGEKATSHNPREEEYFVRAV
jgi:F-type H+-transporting ATPase subunit gamma